MKQYKTIQIGKAKRMQLNFEHTPDEQIAVGQPIILYEEILMIKVGPHLYDVYPEANVKVFERRLKDIEKQKIKDFLEKKNVKISKENSFVFYQLTMNAQFQLNKNMNGHQKE